MGTLVARTLAARHPAKVAGQPEELMQHLTAPATLASFTDAEGAGAHCQVGARMLDWLDETLGPPA